MQPPIPNDELVIRTMKDDMSETNSVSVVSAASATTPGFPLSQKQEKKVKPQYPKVSHAKRSILVGIACALFFGALTAAGWYGYVWWASHQAKSVLSEKKRQVSEMIPKEALAIVAYTLDSQSMRAGVKLLWDAKGTSVGMHIIGSDPRELLRIQDLRGIYYVVMQDSQGPFLLFEKTPLSEQYVSTQSAVKPFEKDGWYIINPLGTDQYTAALDRGTLAESGGLPGKKNASAVAQYIFTSLYASKFFNNMAEGALGASRVAAVVFEVDPPLQDGTIRAHAATPISAMPEKLLPSVSELTTLVPGDAQFGHIGFNFAEDLAAWQQETSRLDPGIVEQPAVRQFISALATPYALFKRTGADGVRDIGIVIQLPVSLRKNLKTGEPIIEQALPALIPLILGKTVGVQPAFHDGTYENVPVRFTNITGQTQALDYTVGDSFILISSSREGIGVLADIALGKGDALKQKDPWKSLFEKSAALTEGKIISFGSIQDPALLSLLPVLDTVSSVPIIVSEETTSTDYTLHATLLSQQ